MSTAVASPHRSSGIMPRLAHEFISDAQTRIHSGITNKPLPSPPGVNSNEKRRDSSRQQHTVKGGTGQEGGPSSSKTDIFSISDATLAEKFQFVTEVGFGNWGSVWKCVRKTGSAKGDTVAVKLVHRSKNPTSSARVRSLWTEFKAIRSLRGASHPNLIRFDAFIITPSYALCVMDFYPRLMPVALPESRARFYFRGLLSAVDFLHAHGCSHNDIKPANILLGSDDSPVLCDFGFAVQYEREVPDRFLSSLSWGTPEYLSPERAKGILHDERLSDVWALGVTMWEIVVGRTPFEKTESEEFLTRDALEVYYGRTVDGDFCGDFSVSRDFEDLIHRMVEPNVKQRYQTCGRALQHRFFEPVPAAPTPTSQQSPSTTRVYCGTPKSAQTPVKTPGSSSRKGTPSRKLEKRDSILVHRDRTSSPIQEKMSPSFPLRPLILGERRNQASPMTTVTEPSTPRRKMGLSSPKAPRAVTPSKIKQPIKPSKISPPSKIPVRTTSIIAAPPPPPTVASLLRTPLGSSRVMSRSSVTHSRRFSSLPKASPKETSARASKAATSKSTISPAGSLKRDPSPPPAIPKLFANMTTPIEKHRVLPPAPKDQNDSETSVFAMSSHSTSDFEARVPTKINAVVDSSPESERSTRSRRSVPKPKRSISFQVLASSTNSSTSFLHFNEDDRLSPAVAAAEPVAKRTSSSMVKKLRALSLRRAPSFSFRGPKSSVAPIAGGQRRTSAAGSMFSMIDTVDFDADRSTLTVDSTAHSSLTASSEISRLESFSRHIQTIIDAGRANEPHSAPVFKRSVSPTAAGDAVEELGATVPILSREELAEFRAQVASQPIEPQSRRQSSGTMPLQASTGVMLRPVSRGGLGGTANAIKRPSIKIRPSLAPSFVDSQSTKTESEKEPQSSTSSKFSVESSVLSQYSQEGEDTAVFKRGHRRIPTAIRTVPSICLTESEDETGACESEPSHTSWSSTDSPAAASPPKSIVVEQGRQLPTWVPEPIDEQEDSDDEDADVDEPTITLVPSPVKGKLFRKPSRASTLRRVPRASKEFAFGTSRSAPSTTRPALPSHAHPNPAAPTQLAFAELVQRSVAFTPSPPSSPTTTRTDSRASSYARPDSRCPSRSRSVLSFFNHWSSSLSRASTPSFSVDSLATSSAASSAFKSEEELEAQLRMRKSANPPKGAKPGGKWRNALKKLF